MWLTSYIESREYFLFYVQKYIAHLAACSGPWLLCDGPLGELPFLKLAYWQSYSKQCNLVTKLHKKESRQGFGLPWNVLCQVIIAFVMTISACMKVAKSLAMSGMFVSFSTDTLHQLQMIFSSPVISRQWKPSKKLLIFIKPTKVFQL